MFSITILQKDGKREYRSLDVINRSVKPPLDKFTDAVRVWESELRKGHKLVMLSMGNSVVRRSDSK